MPSITRQQVGKYTYLYESKSYRDDLGRPRNIKTRVGKIDPVIGKDRYDQWYVDKMTAAGTPIQNPGTRLSDAERREIALSVFDSIQSYGAHYLLLSIAKKIGLIDILSATLTDFWQEIFTLACYLIQSDKPLMYCEDWILETETLPVGIMSSQRISELLTVFDANHRNTFYESWGRHIAEQECIALDITSVSSYSELMTECEWGYNRDNENLPQINLCMLMGETSRLPIYQTVYSGSLTDVTTLKNTLKELTALIPERRLRVVMDKGFYSAKNVNAMLTQDSGCDFIISMPFKDNFAKRQVENARKTIDHVDNIILTGKDPIRGVHKVRAWGKDNKRIETHILFNPAKEMKEKNELYAYVTELKRLAQENPENHNCKSKFEKYLIIRRSSKDPSGYTVNLRKDAIEKELRTKGWLVLISNFCTDTQKAHDMYRAKDVVEKGFCGLKNALGLGRLRVHSDERMQNKLFVGFVALIMMSHIHTVMSEKRLYKTLTMHKLLITLSKIKTASINGTKFIRPVTKEQREILAAFDFEMPVG